MSKNAIVSIYLVEDSQVLRERVMESIAEDERLRVVGYADTEDTALAGILDAAPDVIILDVQLIRGSGINVLRRLSNLALMDRPTTIVLTNYAYPEYMRRAREAGCDYFFDKSSDFARVGGVLDQLARQQRSASG